MKTRALMLSAMLVLAGCATQEPVKIVDAACDNASCAGRLASLQERCRADLDRCNAARSKAEACCREKEAVARQLQALQASQAKAEKDLADRGAELARCQGDLTALQEKSKADAAACETMRQEMQKHAKTSAASAKQLQRLKDLEDRLRDRLQNEIGAKDVEIERLRSQLSVRVLDRILFNTGSAEILPQGRRVLDTVAAALEGGDETIRIEGHADIVPIGTELKKKYFSNWELSTARASSVVRYFQYRHGIAPTRMEAVGFSKYRPIAPNDTEANRQRNRRVEIVLTPWKPVVEECAP
jgi:chemotaxis protein MotB